MSEKGVTRPKLNKLPYKESLNKTERARYEEKLKIIGGSDPYELENFSDDVKILPSVSYPDIVNYLLFTPSPFTLDDLKCYKGLDAHKQFLAGWVSGMSTTVMAGKHVVRAKVMHSMKVGLKPLNPWAIVTENGQVLASHCDCTAGLGEACTHIGSLLFAIDGTVRVRDSRTVTQEPAYWLLPTSVKKVSYAEVRDINFSSAKTMKKQFDSLCDNPITTGTPAPPSAKKAKKPVPPPTDAELQLLFSNLHATGKRSALLSIIPEFADHYIPKTLSVPMPKILTELRDSSAITLNYKELLEKCRSIKIQVTLEEVENLEQATREQCKSKLWFQFRAGRITASKMKSVLRTDPANPAQSLIKSLCYPLSKKFTNEAIQWGLRHEQTAIQNLMCKLKEEGHENVQLENCGLFISEECPFIAATPDCIISCDCCGKQVVEVKCPYSKKGDLLLDQENFYLTKDEDGELRLNRKHDYFYQVQTQMGVTKIDSCLFVVWTTRDVHIEQVLFDYDLWQEMCTSAEHFFYTSVLPELVGKFYTRLPGLDTSAKTCLPLQPVASTSSKTVEKSKNERECWCYCDQIEYGDMVCCDNENCDIKWFHFECLNLKTQPKSKLWYCPDCRKLPEFSRKRLKKL